jgi:hypothetical protein
MWPVLIQAPTRFDDPTEGHRSVTQDRETQHVPWSSLRHVASVLTLTCGTTVTSAHSPSPIKGDTDRSFPLSTHFSPMQGELPPFLRRQLATVWLSHLVIPSAWLMLISLRSFCLRFHDHRSTPPTATEDQAGDLRLPPVRSFPTTSCHQQAPPPCF